MNTQEERHFTKCICQSFVTGIPQWGSMRESRPFILFKNVAKTGYSKKVSTIEPQETIGEKLLRLNHSPKFYQYATMLIHFLTYLMSFLLGTIP